MIKSLMTDDHKACDRLLAQTEQAVESCNWSQATQCCSDFIAGMERHLGIEEQQLFPAFENKTGMTQGPTHVMRMEHEQMRAMFSRLSDAIEEKNSELFLGLSETLMMLIQQHNLKEESILYPMCDMHLGGDSLLVKDLNESLAS